MDVGIGLPNAVLGTPGSLFADWAKRAEERGFSSLATIGRVAYPSHEEIAVLSAAAAVTSRIGLMTNIMVAPTRNFVLLAKEAATLDQLSGGRFTLGMGVGGRPDDFEASGQEFANRGRRFDDGLDLMHRAWRGEPVAGAGKPVSPRPVNGDRVPMAIGGDPTHAIPRMVRWGADFTIGGLPPEMAGGAVEAVRKAWSDAGSGRPLRISALSYYSLGEGTAEVSRHSLRDYYDFLPDFVEFIVEGAVRTPEDARARVKAFEEIGVDEVIFDPTVPDLGQIDLLAEAVL
jgi:alkanesulfonate monooxygenase SsuD/methylene tetrahydromethanopterin reductase-like flavin-dependent oxidoreductase (luciferase family)